MYSASYVTCDTTVFRNNPDNAELVENAATLIMELAKYRKLQYESSGSKQVE